MQRTRKHESSPLMRHRFIPDCPRLKESPAAVTVAPSDTALTDAQLLCGRVAPIFHGQYYKSSEETLNPLHRRGVDFTDVGNILAAIDSQEESTAQKAAKAWKELYGDEQDASQSEDQK